MEEADVDVIQEKVTDILDSVLPRRDSRYDAAHAYLTTFLATDPATRRLAMRALKRYEYFSPDTEHDHAAPPPAAGGAPESGEVDDGAASPPATAKDVPEATRVSPAGTQSGQPRLSCHGKVCEFRDGKEIHRPDPSCSKLSGRRAARG